MNVPPGGPGGGSGGPAGGRLRALLVESVGAPVEAVAALEDAAGGVGLEVRRIGVGRVGPARGAARMVQVLRGDPDGRRLERELAAFAPHVAVAFEAGAAAVLAHLRDRRLAQLALDPESPELPAAVVAFVPELAPPHAWTPDIDRYAVVDDEAAVALTERGVDGARVLVVGPPVGAALAAAARQARPEVRASFGIAADDTVLLLDTRGLGRESISALAVQLALMGRRALVLFDTAGDAETAALLRRQVPGLGLRAKMFGRSGDVARYGRAADAVLARPTARAIHGALALGCAVAALEPQGELEVAEARALVDRGLGVVVERPLALAAALEPLLAGPGSFAAARARAAGGGAEPLARLVRGVAADREAVLVETLEAAGAREAARAEGRDARTERAAPAAAGAPRGAVPGGPPQGLEDLGEGGLDEGDLGGDASAARAGGAAPGRGPSGPSPARGPSGPAGPSRPQVDRLLAELAAAEARTRREMDEARRDADRWDRRREQAAARGEVALAAEAAREADRKRARMHAALEELARLQVERTRVAAGGGRPAPGSPGAARPGAPPPRASLDEMLDAMKRRARDEGSVDDRLRELKRRVREEDRKK